MSSWTPVGSASPYQRGRLILREDTWRLPDGREVVYPVLAVGVLPFLDYAAFGLAPAPLPADDDEFFERRIVPFADALGMALEGEITESVSKVTLLQYAARPPRQ